jgi:orotate phosphoribosyltransferase
MTPMASAEEVLRLVSARKGHFRLESGHHGGLWLDLDTLFVEPRRLRPLIATLAEALRAHAITGICGPLLGGAFLAQAIAAALDIDCFFTERLTPDTRDRLFAAEYRLPRGLQPRVRGQRLAIVDDVMSAGSAARGTYRELKTHGAEPVAIGALLVLGSVGERFFEAEGVPVETVARRPYELWPPAQCPLCAAGMPLEDLAWPPPSA